MKLADADQRKLLPLLDELARGVEELLLAGLTAASESTRRLMDVCIQEASRMRLLRLSATLRTASEELLKFIDNKEGFSRKRLFFFLNRSWLLCKGIARALREGDEPAFTDLIRAATGEPAGRIEVVTLGVVRRQVPGVFCGFDFRLRCLSGPVPDTARLTWSCGFQLNPKVDVPPEGYLQLPQKQGFKPVQLLDRKVVAFSDVTLTADGRVTLGEKSKVEQGGDFRDWGRFTAWGPEGALGRLRQHRPGPLDLEVDLQEEVVLREWSVGAPAEEEGQLAFPITSGRATFYALVNPKTEAKTLGQALTALARQPARPPLFGLLHYERCRLVLQPLTVFATAGPDWITISREKVNMKGRLQTMKF